MPVNSDAIVGNRNGGVTAVADHVTDPSFTKRLMTGMGPPFSDDWSTPSNTTRITYSARSDWP